MNSLLLFKEILEKMILEFPDLFLNFIAKLSIKKLKNLKHKSNMLYNKSSYISESRTTNSDHWFITTFKNIMN